MAVKIEGLPFRATQDQIYDFFAGYEVVRSSLIFGLQNDGRKSGLGFIIFENEEEAYKVCIEKNDKFIGSRYVELSQISYGQYKSYANQYC